MKSLIVLVIISTISFSLKSQGFLGKRVFVEYNTGITPTFHKKFKNGKLKPFVFFLNHTLSISYVKSSSFSFGLSCSYSSPSAALAGLKGSNGGWDGFDYSYEEDEFLHAFRGLGFVEWSRKGSHAPTSFYTRLAFGVQTFSFKKQSIFRSEFRNTFVDFATELKLGKRWSLFNSLLLDIGVSFGVQAALMANFRENIFIKGFFSRPTYYSTSDGTEFNHYNSFKAVKNDVITMTRRQLLARNLFKIRVGLSFGAF